MRELAAREAPHLKLEIDSAGTGDYHLGAAPDPRSQRAAMKRGIDISTLRARQVTAQDFARFDLILAMDQENLRELQAMRPARSRATLKLLLDFVPNSATREVPDPYCGGAGAFEKVLDLTEAAARGLLASLQERA